MAVMLDSGFVLQGKKEKKRREKKSGKELLQIGESEEQLSFFEELKQEVRNKDPSLLTLCGMPWLRCQCVERCCFGGLKARRPFAPAGLLQERSALLIGHVGCFTYCFLPPFLGVLPACSRHSLPCTEGRNSKAGHLQLPKDACA